MNKIILTTIALVAIWSQSICQKNTDYKLQCEKLFTLYQSGDSAQITEQWKLEKNESIPINDLRKNAV